MWVHRGPGSPPVAGRGRLRSGQPGHRPAQHLSPERQPDLRQLGRGLDKRAQDLRALGAAGNRRAGLRGNPAGLWRLAQTVGPALGPGGGPRIGDGPWSRAGGGARPGLGRGPTGLGRVRLAALPGRGGAGARRRLGFCGGVSWPFRALGAPAVRARSGQRAKHLGSTLVRHRRQSSRTCRGAPVRKDSESCDPLIADFRPILKPRARFDVKSEPPKPEILRRTTGPRRTLDQFIAAMMCLTGVPAASSAPEVLIPCTVSSPDGGAHNRTELRCQ